MRKYYINPLFYFLDIFPGTHVRPCVQVATPLATGRTIRQKFSFQYHLHMDFCLSLSMTFLGLFLNDWT